MKTFLVSLALASAALAAQGGQQQTAPAKHDRQDKQTPAHKEHKEHKDAAAHDKSAAEAGDRVRRGEPIGDSKEVAFADVLKEPAKYAGKTVVIEGVVERVCKAEGCWMQITPEAAAGESVRVTFDHKFVVPKDADSMKFRAEGEFSLKVLTKAEVDHLVKDDGAKIKTNPDGTANEISFLATGVELWK